MRMESKCMKHEIKLLQWFWFDLSDCRCDTRFLDWSQSFNSQNKHLSFDGFKVNYEHANQFLLQPLVRNWERCRKTWNAKMSVLLCLPHLVISFLSGENPWESLLNCVVWIRPDIFTGVPAIRQDITSRANSYVCTPLFSALQRDHHNCLLSRGRIECSLLGNLGP